MISSRSALTVLFAVDGTLFASWVSRLPQVQSAVGAGDGGLGVALVGTAVGALAAMPVIGWWCRRHAPGPVAAVAALVFAATVGLPGLANSPAALFGMLLALGAAYGAVDVSMNSTAVQVAERLNRPLLPSFHAAFSAGNVLGAAGGALFAARAVPVEAHLLGAGVAGIVVLACCVPALWRVESGVTVHQRPARGGNVGLVLAAASLTFGTAFGEGAVANWSGIHLQQAAAASAGAAPLGYAAFALAQVIGRVAGTRVTERIGARRFALFGAGLAAIGLLVTLVPQFWPAVLGYFAAGLGVSCLFPLGIARAGELAGSGGVAVASTLGYGGFLLGPPLIGALSTAGSLSVALLLPVLLMGACIAGAITLRANIVTKR